MVEVSVSSRVRDTGPKLRLYERSGVREYLVVRPETRRIAWHLLADGAFQAIDPDADGLFRSRVFPGLWLDPETLWNNDLASMYAVIQRGPATAQHAAFASKLTG